MRGLQEVLGLQRLLVEFSRHTGQAGAMDWLDYFVTSPESLRKIPYVLLVGKRGGLEPFARDRPVQANELLGAVVIYEYRVAELGTRVFATDDFSGVRSVLAEAPRRMEVARAALRALMQAGAVTALITVDGGQDGEIRNQPGAESSYRTAIRTRTVPRHLPLADSYEATLATLGADTRRNFKRYRRRAEAHLATEFVPEVKIQRAEFLELNRRSTNPMAEQVAQWRFDLFLESAGRPAPLLAGMCGGDGQWLSLVGGRRYDDVAEIDWQINIAGLPRHSLCTVMRAYLIEDEIKRGTRKLILQGGTPHPMRFSFAAARTTDLLGERRWSPRLWMLRKFSRFLFPEKNLLGAALRDFSGEEPQASTAPAPGKQRLAGAA